MANPNHLGEPGKNLVRDTMREEAMETRTEELGWTEEHLQKLLSGMIKNIRKTEERKIYTKGQTLLCWDRVAFHPYTAEMCEKKWMEISKKMRKMRTLTELVNEAKGAIENPFNGKNHKIHPNFPKKACPPNSMFYQEKYAELKKQHPEMTITELFKLSCTLYMMLPEEEKARYNEKVQRANELYAKGIELLRKPHPDWKAKGIPHKDHLNASSSTSMSAVPMVNLQAVSAVTEVMLPEPKSPPTCRGGHMLFCSEQMKELKAELGHVSSRQRLSLISAQWRTLPKNEKLVYQQRADEQKREYLRELQNWFNNLSASEKAEFWKQNPKKRCLLEEFTERSRKRTSDSEDDDIQIDTTSSEDDPHECEGKKVSNKGRRPGGDRTLSSSDGSGSEGDT